MKDWNKLYHKKMELLKKELPSHLRYHRWEHIEYVITIAQYIAEHENISEDDILLIKTAALFHDYGFVHSGNDHEEASIEYCKKVLPEYGYTPDEIDKISGMIMATKIPQHPTTKLEEVLADADLEYLGTDSFKVIGNLLYEEILHDHPNMTINEWNKIQIWFLQNHEYHTDFCIKNRAPKKAENLRKLIEESQQIQ